MTIPRQGTRPPAGRASRRESIPRDQIEEEFEESLASFEPRAVPVRARAVNIQGRREAADGADGAINAVDRRERAV